MGDSGLACIVQADRLGPFIDGALDVGWWPLDHFGTGLYLEFLGSTLGWDMTYTTVTWRSAKASYYETLAPLLAASLAVSKPALCHSQWQFIAAAMADGDPPLMGGWAVEYEGELVRIDSYPWVLYVFGDKRDRLSREVADVIALQHAVELHRELSPCAEGKLTGTEAFALWAETLRDLDHEGEARWHGNMVRHIKLQRASAIVYLKLMAERHEEDVAVHLCTAADYYQQVLDEIDALDLSEIGLVPPPWEDVALAAERMAVTEGEAVREIEAALAELGHDPLGP
jgi:hypothetical protein